MFKKLLLTLLIVCVLSVFAINNIHAGVMINDWRNAERRVDNAESLVDSQVNDYHSIRSDMETLISFWNANEDDIKSNRDVTLIATGGAIISAIISIATANPVGLVPASYVLVVAGFKGQASWDRTSATSAEIMDAMSTLLSLMDTARSNIDAAYYGGYLSLKPPDHYGGSALSYTFHTRGYDGWYDKYLEMGANHVDGYDVSTLESSVKMGKLSGYYHDRWHLNDSKSHEDHTFARFLWFSHWKVKPDLEKKYKCHGVCGTLFRTPYEAYTTHRVVCGVKRKIYNAFSVAYRITSCPNVWYSCERSTCPDADDHVDNQKKFETDQQPVTPQQDVSPQDQESTPSTTTSPSAPSPTPVSVNLQSGDGSYTYSVGDVHVGNLTLGAAPSYVFWYIQDPWDTSPRLVYEDTSGSLTSQLSYSLSNPGNYVFSVSGTRASDGAAITGSYTVYVSQ